MCSTNTTTKDCIHYSGRIWLSAEVGKRGNVYAEIGEELFHICYLPVITDELIRAWVEATGWRPEEWL